MQKLTIDKKRVLEAEVRKAHNIAERNRLCVILGHDEGLTVEELAKALRISHATVCNYLSRP